MTWRATGAAACAPKPPFSTSTESAIFGLSTGAYARYHAWSRRRSSSLCSEYFSPCLSENTCEVPVLPADAYAAPLHAAERVLNRREMLRLDADRMRGLRLDLVHFAGRQVADRLAQVRAERDAVVGDDRDGVHLLDRRERVVALADAGGDRITEIPFAMLVAVALAGESRALPVARRQHARKLALDIDARLVAEAQLRHEARVVVDVRLVREHVVIRVARHDDRLVHVDRAVTAGLVVAETVRGARDLEKARIVDHLRRGALARGERAQRKEGLDRRARRIGTAQRAVQQRLVRRLVQRFPVRRIDAVDEKIRIEARLRDECEHLAVGRIHRDQRAAPLAELGLGDLLQLDVQRELQIVPRCRRRARQRAHGAPAGVDLDLFPAGRTMQLALVGELDAHFADVVGALVVRRLVPFLDALVVLVVDAADVADHVCGDLAVRVMAKQARLDLDAGKAIAVDGEARDFLVGELRAKRQALEVLRLLEQLAEALAIARLHIDDLAERFDRLVEVLHARRLDLERVRGVALRQHDAVAVGDDAAIGHNGHDRDAVRLGERLIVAMLDDLQVEEAAEQSAERGHDQHGGDREAPLEQEYFALRIAKLGRAEAAVVAVTSPRAEQISRHQWVLCMSSPRTRGPSVFRRKTLDSRLPTTPLEGRLRGNDGDVSRMPLYSSSPQSSAGERGGRCGHCSTTDSGGHNSAPTTGGSA